MENTVVGTEDVVGGRIDERTERGRKCFFPGVVLAEVEESGKKIQCGGNTVRSVFFNNLMVTHVIFVVKNK
jgi:hypothetical protein